MLCEEKDRLLDACVTAADRQAEAAMALSAIAAKDNRVAFKEARAHAQQARQDAEEARLALHLIQKLMAAELRTRRGGTFDPLKIDPLDQIRRDRESTLRTSLVQRSLNPFPVDFS